MFIFKSVEDYKKWARSEWDGMDMNDEEIGVMDEDLEGTYEIAKSGGSDYSLILSVIQMRDVERDLLDYKFESIEDVKVYVESKGLGEDLITEGTEGMLEYALRVGMLGKVITGIVHQFIAVSRGSEEAYAMADKIRAEIGTFLGYNKEEK